MLRFRADGNKVLFRLKSVLLCRCDSSLSGLPPSTAMPPAVAPIAARLWHCSVQTQWDSVYLGMCCAAATTLLLALKGAHLHLLYYMFTVIYSSWM